MPGGSRNPLVVGRVIGDVLEPFESSIPLRVAYGHRDVTNGCELRPSQVATQARVSIGGDDLRTFFTLVRIISGTHYLTSVTNDLHNFYHLIIIYLFYMYLYSNSIT